MNKILSFEICKLLKEKSFNLKVVNFYNYEKLSLISDKDRQIGKLINYNPINWNSVNQHYTSAPTIAEVLMWLYEKYGIWVSVLYQRHSENKHWKYNIRQLNGIETVLWEHKTIEEAYEAAIEFVLKEVIN
jgi:hypothetical protein